MTKETSNNGSVTYIGATGPLLKACEQVFEWKEENGQKLLVILWHKGWKDGSENYWEELAKNLPRERGTKFLVTFFEANLDACRRQEGGSRLSLLFRLLGEDPDHPKGWCRITDFKRLSGAMKGFQPDNPNRDLRVLANGILGFTTN